MSLQHLTLTDARNLHLAAQGMLKKPRRRAQPADIPAIISRMSLLQIDTINVVARSPYLVLFSRLGQYQPEWLDESLLNGELMEYWAHEACFLPRSDFHLIRHRMLMPEKMGWKYKDTWMKAHEAEIEQLIQHIQLNGPVRAADFEHPQKGTTGWWEWKPHKRHLEGLFTAGKVMVVERRKFQRVYDLTDRVMPHWDDERDLLSQEEAELLMLNNSARSLGIFREQWLADYYRLKRPNIKMWREIRAEQQQIIPVSVEHLGPMWLHAEMRPLLELVGAGKLVATHSAVLSPFDPVVWDRKRAEQLFDFSYRLECYTPATKRHYGYFVLPLLHRGQLVGRMDAKMHRKNGVLDVISLYLQEGVKSGAILQKGVHQAISDFARWQLANRITLGNCPRDLFADCRQGWEIDPAS